MAAKGDPGDGGSGSRVRLLVVVLVVQLVVAAALIVFVIAGWPWVDRAPASTARTAPVPERFLPGSSAGSVPTPSADRFDSAGAFALLRRQVDRYGWRPAGSRSVRRLAVDLRGRLPNGRLEALGPRHPRLRNVTGRIPGRRPAILVAAHYDVEARPRGFVGANDGAAGTAAVVGVAQALTASPVANGREVRFALFDGEEEPPGSNDFHADGLRGSRAYERRHRGQVSEVVLLDYVAGRGLRLPREGSSDAALWSRLRAAAARVGVGAAFPDEVGATVVDDHTPFLEAGVPAIDLIDFEYPWRDTLADDMSKVSARSLDVTGEAVVELVDELRRR